MGGDYQRDESQVVREREGADDPSILDSSLMFRAREGEKSLVLWDYSKKKNHHEGT